MSINIVVPEVGESIVDARVARWLKKPGDAVAAGEPLVELETDKVDVEVSAPAAGVLETVAHGDGADVKIGEVLGTLSANKSGKSDESEKSGESEKSDKSAEGKPPPASKQADVAATPSARRTAREKNVPLDSVKAEGPRVTKADVERSSEPPAFAKATEGKPVAPSSAKASEGKPSAPVARPAPSAPLRTSSHPSAPEGVSREETRTRMSKRRATIAKRLVEAQQTAAMLTTFNEIDMSAVMALRERQKETFKKKYGFGLGITSFFVKASIAALRDIPRLNAEIQGDEMVLKHYYDIGIAVGAAEGLVVPVLRDADRLSFADIEGGIRGFAAKVTDGTLTIDDLRGGTFSITNGGVFGSLMSTPILNPPQVGILGLHAIKDRPVAVGGQIVLRPMMYVALTYDHRIVDGSEAVRFLVRVKELIEDPGVLLVES